MSSYVPSGFARSRVSLPTLTAVAALVCSMAGVQIGAAPQARAATLADEVATPPMGWNTWNSFHCNISEQLIKASADRIVSSGMKAAGYEYVVVDDCWMANQRDANGKLQADPNRFGSGMKALGDYLHARGLKFGIYQSPTDKTCEQRLHNRPGTGSEGFERKDAETFAEWGVDYLKYDWCSKAGTLEIQKQRFSLMRDELARATAATAAASGQSERPIVYSINANSWFDENTGSTFDWSSIANLWRTTEDIKNAWLKTEDTRYGEGVLDITRFSGPLGAQAGPGHWNDPDMLEVGVTKDGQSLTPDESRSHMSLWAQMAAPLMAGHKLDEMTPETLSILTNQDVLAVDQDTLGRAARIVTDSDAQLLTVRELAGGDWSVSLTNTSDSAATVTTSVSALGIAGAPSYAFKNLWTGAVGTTSGTLSATLAPHATALLRLTPSGPIASTQAAPSNGTFEIASASAPAQTIDNSGSSVTGKQMITWERKRNDNQRWTLTGNPDGTFAVKSAITGLCLDIKNNSSATGAAVIQWTCGTNKSNQKFSLTPAGGNRYNLVAQNSGLAVTPSGTGSNSLLTQQPVSSAKAWTFIRLG
ncbi:alpha-galactosidase [Streptomyces sp. NPDC058667]|uniref:alpha-galactosidase n=1 Tax=Streptomyces sp. NPDC058667 TaxID=3346588 RepID=UPI00364F2DB0